MDKLEYDLNGDGIVDNATYADMLTSEPGANNNTLYAKNSDGDVGFFNASTLLNGMGIMTKEVYDKGSKGIVDTANVANNILRI